MAWLANNAATDSPGADAGAEPTLVVVVVVSAAAYLLVQYSRTDLPGVVVGTTATVAGLVALILAARLVAQWPDWLAALELVAGSVLLGAVTNGMLLGHWYLNQPGLQPSALARLTALALVAVASTGILGGIAFDRLSDASTKGAILGLEGFGESFGMGFYLIWLGLLGFTGVIVWMARRCVRIRSIQSATGLYYVAILTAGVSEFVVRYLMVNAS
jgi:hypothetical protein